MSIKKVKVLKTISGVVLVLSGVIFFFLFILGLGLIGTCSFQTEIKELENPQNINLLIDTRCTAGRNTWFIVTNRGEDLALNAIRGSIQGFGIEPHKFDNVALCLEDGSRMSNRFGRPINPVDDVKSCKPVILKNGEHYQFFNMSGPWELMTNKGNVSGFSFYRISDGRILDIFILVLFPASLVLYVVFKKKEKKLKAKGS